MSMEEVSVILAEAVARPTFWGSLVAAAPTRTRGAPLGLGVARSCTGTTWALPGCAWRPWPPLTAADSGQVTDAAMEGPFGFCLFASRPGKWSAWTPSTSALLRRRRRWQLTAVDVATRIAVVQLIVGDKTATDRRAFLSHLKKALRHHGITLEGVLTDNGPEFTGRDFTTARTALDLIHHRIPPRSPNHSAVCERFRGTVLREFYRPHSPAAASTTSPCSTDPASLAQRLATTAPATATTLAGRTPVQARKLQRRTRHTAA